MAVSRHSRQFYWPHHFVILPLALLMAIYAGRHYANVAGESDPTARLWFTVMGVAVVGLLTLLLLRQHYALRLQDRLIRLEVRHRYFAVTGRSLEPLEERLTLARIIALRFAPADKLPALVEAAMAESLTPAAIIARIGDDYQPDPLRV